MNISAVVVSYNECQLLDDCLSSLKTCDQLLVVDLGSKDNSVEVARRYTSQVIFHKHEPVVENVVPDILDVLTNEWFIRADPDEVYPAELFSDIEKCIKDNPQLAMIEIPIQYYFFGKPLTTTVWGGIRYFPKVLNKQRVAIHKRVHAGTEIKDEYQKIRVSYNGKNAVKHYWITSWGQLIEKHRRYLLWEGKSKYEQGERFSWIAFAKAVFWAFTSNLIKYKGLLGGMTGISLSFFYTWYIGMSWLSLRQYQKQNLSDPFV
ncbi:MAG: glycosyltransferase [Chloroflexi bacterium]|nr:glycosyltransferase [Chloroflexota bacterium]